MQIKKWPFVLGALALTVAGFAIWGPRSGDDSGSGDQASSTVTTVAGATNGDPAATPDENASGGEPGKAEEPKPQPEPDLSQSLFPSADAREPEAFSSYPVPDKPAGGCPGTDGDAVDVTLGAGPDPGCVTVRKDQGLRFNNATDQEIVLALGELQETINPGDSWTFNEAGSALGSGDSYFWSPGRQELTGIVVVD